MLVPRWSRLLLSRLASWNLFRPLWSEGIIAETWRVLTWKALTEGLSYSQLQLQANRMLNHLVDVMEFVSIRIASGMGSSMTCVVESATAVFMAASSWAITAPAVGKLSFT